MAHPESVLSTRIQTYDSDFYDKLTAMESFCYDNSEQEDVEDGVEEYQPFFQDLNDAIEGYFDSNEFSRDALFDLLQGMYTYVKLNVLYEYREDLKEQLQASEIFDMDGFIEDTLSRPDDYYDDFFIEIEEDDELGPIETPRAPNLEDSVSRLTAVDEETGVNVIVASTNAKVRSLQSTIQRAVEKKINKLLYQDEEIKDTIAKEDMYDAVFVAYGFDFYVDFFGIEDVNPFDE